MKRTSVLVIVAISLSPAVVSAFDHCVEDHVQIAVKQAKQSQSALPAWFNQGKKLRIDAARTATTQVVWVDAAGNTATYYPSKHTPMLALKREGKSDSSYYYVYELKMKHPRDLADLAAVEIPNGLSKDVRDAVEKLLAEFAPGPEKVPDSPGCGK